MATITAVKAGNWSDTTVWTGGVLPGVNDVASTAFAITIDQDITVQQLLCTAGTPITAFTAGGSTTRNITLLSATNGLQAGGYVHTTLSITNSGTTNLITSMQLASSNFQLLYVAGLSGGTVNLTLTGTLSYSTTSGYPIQITGTNYTVNVTSADIVANANAFRFCIVAGTSNTVNWTGNIYGSNNTSASAALLLNSATCTINYIGNVVGNGGPGIASGATGGNINLAGTFTAGAVCAIYSTSSTIIKPTGTVVNVGDVSALNCVRLRLDNTQPLTWLFQTPTAGVNRTLYTPGVPLGNPATTNVKNGITYGPSNELTGTLAMPSASNVRKGIAVGDTFGTAELTASDMWNALITDMNTEGSIGELIKKLPSKGFVSSQIIAL